MQLVVYVIKEKVFLQSSRKLFLKITYLQKLNMPYPSASSKQILLCQLAVTICFTQLWYVFIENMARKALLLRVLLRQYS